jgi:probable F420-dependent oxidoreductase
MRIGVKIANFGPDAGRMAASAAAAEDAGADSLWLSDRVVVVDPTISPYPFTPDHSVPWTTTTPFHDVVVSMAMLAAATSRVEIAAGVLVVALRNPVVLAKQLASIDVQSGGRVILGVGSGWMREEYDLLGVPFAERGGRTDAAVAFLRACWSGAPGPIDGPFDRLPAGVFFHPAPARRIPVLVGGMSAAALRRAGRNDGWFGYLDVAGLDVDDVARSVALVRAARAADGSGGAELRVVLRLVGDTGEVARLAPALAAAGVTEVVVDVDTRQPHEAARTIARLRDAAGEPAAGEPARPKEMDHAAS